MAETIQLSLQRVTLQHKNYIIILKIANLAPVYMQHEGEVCYPELKSAHSASFCFRKNVETFFEKLLQWFMH
jgi:hypothetical protein